MKSCWVKCLLTGIMVFFVSSAVHAGNISGRVTDANGNAVAGATVKVQGYTLPHGNPVSSTEITDAEGYYTFQNLAAGKYKLFVDPPAGSGLLYQYYRDSSNEQSAKVIYIEDDVDAEDKNVTLEAGGSISGTVLDNQGSAMGGVKVYAYDSYLQVKSEAITNADGSYTIPDLYSGIYQVWVDLTGTDYFAGGLTAEYFGNVLSPELATPVEVAEGSITHGTNFSIYPGGRIRGLVADALGSPLVDTVVYICDPATGNIEYKTETDETGAYTFFGLLTGIYSVRVGSMVDTVLNTYIEGGYYSAGQSSGTTLLTILEGGLEEGIDFSLASVTLGTIAGTVRDGSGAGIAGARVLAYDFVSGESAETTTDESGAYRITGLLNGSYNVKAESPIGGNYIWEYYGYARELDGADTVGVTVGSETTAIDFVLAEGRSISGTVTDTGQAPLANLPVFALDSRGIPAECVFTDSNGSYSILGLPPDRYLVAVAIDTEYVGEYYDNTRDPAQASAVDLTGVSELSGIDFSIEQCGSVSGTVSCAGTPVGAFIYVYNTGGEMIGQAQSDDATGSFTIDSLVPGPCRFEAVPKKEKEYMGRIFQGETGEFITVNPGGQTQPTITFELIRYGTISGTVTDGTEPLAWIEIAAFDTVTGARAGYGETDAEGTYTIAGLPDGSYRVRTVFTEKDVGFYSQEYGQTLTVSDVGKDLSGINFVLVEQGSITGCVTGLSWDMAGDVWVPWARLSLVDPATGHVVNTARSRADGQYTIVGVPAGTYTVKVDSPIDYEYSDYIPESQAQITVSENGTVSNVDFRLELYGRITGRVTNASGSPIRGATVAASLNGRDYLQVQTDSNGNYMIKGLRDGTYTLRVEDGAEYVGQTLASQVQMAAGNTYPAMNFTLSRAGSITGTIRDATGLSIRSVPVYAYDSITRNCRAVAYTNSVGTYIIKGLRTGNYYVKADPSYGMVYAWEYYMVGGHAHSMLSATQVHVEESGTPPVIDFTPMRCGRISGRVLYEETVPLPNAHVTAALYNAGSRTVDVVTDADGRYTITGIIPDQEYVVQAIPPQNLNLVEEYYLDMYNIGDAARIMVSEDSEMTDIDFALLSNSETSVYEYLWSKPARPTIIQPANASTNVSLTPLLRATEFTDEAGDTHSETVWEIVDITRSFIMRTSTSTTTNLTALQIPSLMLQPSSHYHVRVKYIDNHGVESEFSNDVSFDTTGSTGIADANNNGIPDSQEVTGATDLDRNNVSDEDQPDLKRISTFDASAQMGVIPAGDVTEILELRSVDPATISDNTNRPLSTPFGLLDFRLKVKEGAQVVLIIHLSSPAPEDMVWYTYDEIYGWRPYSNATFSSDRMKLVLLLQDGNTDLGDIDGVANGIIVDPSGIGHYKTSSGSTPKSEEAAAGSEQTTFSGTSGGSDGSGSSGGCFLSTAVRSQQSAGAFIPFLVMAAFCGLAVLRQNRKQ